MIFLQSANIPPSLEDDIRRLSEHQVEQEDEDANEVFNIVYVCVMAFIMFLIQECLTYNQHQETEDWMLICQHNADYAIVDCDNDHNWS